MKINLMNERFLHFITILIVSTLLGYLSHAIMNGIFFGILVGIGFVLGEELFKKMRKKK